MFDASTGAPPEVDVTEAAGVTPAETTAPTGPKADADRIVARIFAEPPEPGAFLTDATLAEWAGRTKPGPDAKFEEGKRFELWRLTVLEHVNLALLGKLGRRLVNRGGQKYSLIATGAVALHESDTRDDRIARTCATAIERLSAQRTDILTNEEKQARTDALSRTAAIRSFAAQSARCAAELRVTAGTGGDDE